MKLSQRTGTLLAAVALVVLTVLAYYQVGGHDFINLDDNVYITSNPNVQAGLSLEQVRWALTSGYGLNWHPLTWISHMADVELFGMNPGAHHLVSLFLHLLASLILFFVWKNMTGSLWGGAFVAGVFALHPLHVESVAWAAERKDVLSGLFWMMAMACYLWYVRRKKLWSYLLLCLVYALGLMAKPMLVTLPFVFLLLDYWPLQRFNVEVESQDKRRRAQRRGFMARYRAVTGRLLVEKIPLLLLVIASSVVTFLVQREGQAVSTLEGLPLRVRISNALVSYIVYLRKAFWPNDLGVFYPHPLDTFQTAIVLAAGALLAGATVLFLWQARRRPYLIVGWLWFIGTLVPTIGIVQVGQQAYADRYMYLPLIGLAIMVTFFVVDVAQTRNRRPLIAALGVVVSLLLTGLTHVQASYWKDSETLFAQTLRVTGENPLAHNNLGVALHLEGDYDGAAMHYREVLRLNPDDEQAYRNLVLALTAKGDTKALAEAYIQRGTRLGRTGRTAEAQARLQDALRLAPRNDEAHNNLGIVLAMQGKTAEAFDEFTEAVRYNPNNWNARYNLGVALEQQGKSAEAYEQFAASLRIKPDYQDARRGMERTRAIQR